MKEPSSEVPDNTVLMEFRKVGLSLDIVVCIHVSPTIPLSARPHLTLPTHLINLQGFKLGDKLLRPAMVKVSVNDDTPPNVAAFGASSEEE